MAWPDDCCFKCEGPCPQLKAEMEARMAKQDKRKEKKEQRKAAQQKKSQEEIELERAVKAGPPKEDWEKLEDMTITKPKKDEPKASRRVTILQDHLLMAPELWMTVYVPDQQVEAMFAEMFIRASCYKADNVDEADLVVFTGGPDVDPILYHEKPHPKTDVNVERDRRDIALYMECLEKGIPMLGICRGAQFLHVMNGGKLWQHVDGHQGSHSMRVMGSSEVIDRVSSTHHQMVRPHKGMKVLAIADEAKEKWSDNRTCQRHKSPDIEAFFYRKTCCLGIQGHPEFKSYQRFTMWSLKMIEQHVRANPDVHLDNGVYRIKPELLMEEKIIIGAKEK